MNTKYTISSLVAVSMLLSLTGCGEKEEQKPLEALADMKLPVKTQSIDKQSFSRIVRVQGSLEAVNSAIVSARIDGPLLTVDCDLGDRVITGETKLFEVDPILVKNNAVIARENLATAEAEVKVKEAKLEKEKAVYEKSVLDAERYDRLFKEGRVTQNEQEQMALSRHTAEADVAVAESELALSKQNVSQAKAQLAIAERQLEDATILAPITGIINARQKEPGEMVNNGTAIFEIQSTAELKAMAFLPAQYYSEVVPGKTEVALTVNGEKLPKAIITAKSPAINQKLRTFEVKAVIPGAEAIAPGMMADFEIILETREGVSVPELSILRRAAGNVVFVDDGSGKAVERVVSTGIRMDGRAEILSGVEPGEKVITQGQTQLYDGRPIRIAE